MRGVLVLTAVLLSASQAGAAETPAINRIIDEGLNHSHVMDTAGYLADVIGPRLTNSPGMRTAEAWTTEEMQRMGLVNVHLEGFEFGRGWSGAGLSVRMTAPRPIDLRAIQLAWYPATNGVIEATIVVAPMEKVRHFDAWRGKLKGKIVLVSRPRDGDEPDEAPFQRLKADDIAKLNQYKLPETSKKARDRRLERAAFARRLNQFLANEGALAMVKRSRRDGGMLHGEGYQHEVGQTPAIPGVEIAAEDYGRLVRLAERGLETKLAIDSRVAFDDSDTKAYNVIGDIGGSDPRAGYVMAGAHLDSWVAGDGASDNGAGSAVVLEAARILKALGLKPKRTIRFALWAGEEQGLFGSLDYVTRYLAVRPKGTEAQEQSGDPYYYWRSLWPITVKPGHAQLAAYFNVDNGSGRIRGVHAEGNVAAVPVLRAWLAPFASMEADNVVASPTAGTDHEFMQSVGIPAFQFIQDPLDYGSRVHHSNADTLDHVKAKDMRQNAVILAAMLWQAANADAPLPRMPIPSKPVDVPDDYEFDD